MITTVIFDLWGTLIQNMADEHPFDVMRHFLGMEGSRKDFAKALARSKVMTFPGTAEECWEDFFEQEGIPYTKRDIALRMWIEENANFEVFDDTEPVLGWLKEKGFELGLASGISQHAFENVKERCSFMELFDFFVLSYDVGHMKPADEYYQAIFDKTEARPEEILYVGDSRYFDILPGKNAGMRTCYLGRDGHSLPEADHNITSLEELREIIRSYDIGHDQADEEAERDADTEVHDA